MLAQPVPRLVHDARPVGRRRPEHREVRDRARCPRILHFAGIRLVQQGDRRRFRERYDENTRERCPARRPARPGCAPPRGDLDALLAEFAAGERHTACGTGHRSVTRAERLPALLDASGTAFGNGQGIGAVIVALVLPGRPVTPESGDRGSELADVGQ